MIVYTWADQLLPQLLMEQFDTLPRQCRYIEHIHEGIWLQILIYAMIFVPQYEISNNVVCVTSKGSDQPAHMRSLIRAFASRLNILWLLSY